MPEEDSLDLDIEFPWEGSVVEGLALLRQQLKDMSPIAKQYAEFWWFYSWWQFREATLGEAAAGPEPKFKDFARLS